MRKMMVFVFIIVVSLLLSSCAKPAVHPSPVNVSPNTVQDSGNYYDEIDLSDSKDSVVMNEIHSVFLWKKDAAFVYTSQDPETKVCRTLLSTFDSSGKLLNSWNLSSLYTKQYEFVSSVAADANGILHVISYIYNDGSNTYSLDTLSEDLTQITAQIPLRLPEGFFPEDFIYAKNGIAFVKSEDSVLSISPEGSTTSMDLPSILSLCCMNGNVFAVTCQATDAADFLSVIPLADNQPGTATAAISLPHSVGTGFCFSNGDLYYSDDNAMYKIAIDSNTGLNAVRLFLYTDTNLVTSAGVSYCRIFAFSPDCILYRSLLSLFTSATDFTTKSQYVLLKRTDEKVVKNTLTIGGPGISYDSLLLAAIQEYNRTNDSYQVKIRDYPLPDESSLNADPLTVDILAGNAPDILYSAGQSLDNYISGNQAAPLEDVFSQDSANERSLFWPNILSLCERNQQMVQVFPWFTMSGLIGEKSLLNNDSGLSIDRVGELKATLPDASSLVFANLSSQQLLLYSTFSDLSQFVDYENSTADFSSRKFQDLLTFAKDYGSDISVDENVLLQSHQLLFCNVRQLGDPLAFSERYRNFASEAMITGYPSIAGGTAICIPGCALSVRSDTKNADGCYDFLAFLLSEKVQDDAADAGQIPLRISSLDKRLSTLESTPVSDPEHLPADSASAFVSNISSIAHASQLDTRIFAIIMEETAPYFAGDKPADTVCSAIQNRVQLLLEESKGGS